MRKSLYFGAVGLTVIIAISRQIGLRSFSSGTKRRGTTECD